MKLSRRRFLIGLTAAGTLAALPLPSGLSFASSLEESEALGLPFDGEMVLRLIGPITRAHKPIDGHLPLDVRKIESLISVAPAIDITSLESTADSFLLGLPDLGSIHFSGLISPEIVRKFRDGTIMNSALQIPSPDDVPQVCYSFQCYISELRMVHAS